jgi:hypothetical protein
MAEVLTPGDVLVPLRGGPVVPLSILQRILDCEHRGVQFRLQPNGQLLAGPPASLTAEDVAFVRAHRALITDCVANCDAMAKEPL